MHKYLIFGDKKVKKKLHCYARPFNLNGLYDNLTVEVSK